MLGAYRARLIVHFVCKYARADTSRIVLPPVSCIDYILRMKQSANHIEGRWMFIRYGGLFVAISLHNSFFILNIEEKFAQFKFFE